MLLNGLKDGSLLFLAPPNPIVPSKSNVFSSLYYGYGALTYIVFPYGL